MMPGVGFAEMVVLVLVAIVVIGPKDLPLMMRKFGRFTGKMRAMAFEFRQGFEELGRQAELEELRREVADLKRHTGMEEFTREMEKDRADMERDLREAASASETPRPAPAARSAEQTQPVSALPAATETPSLLPPEAIAALNARLGDYHEGEDHGPPPAPLTAPIEGAETLSADRLPPERQGAPA
ncbi:MAG: Sec-independent protein translocase protein TatB [Alphaproteobacteria bacterium]|nr:Sec-independent protein translocase protein TatB [Alphaproteobacteria bacterium]